MEFGRFADLNRRQRRVGKPETFDFLGLTHYCTTTLRGRFRLGRKPVAKRVNRALARIDEVLRKRWHHDIWEVGRWLGRVCNGWLNYFAVPGSGRFIRAFLRRLQTMRRILTCLVATWILILGCGVAAAQTSKTIRLTNGEWQPYLSKDTPHQGFASHIVIEAFALVGVEVDYGFFPWKRSFKLAKEGTWDGSVVWVDSDERREHFLYSDPVVPSKFVFFHLMGSDFDWNSYEDLRGIRIGGTLEYAYSEEFDAAEKAGIIKTNRAPSDETGLKKLLKGRIAAFPGEVMVTYAQIRGTFSQEDAALFTHHPKAINEDPMYLLLSKKVAGNEAMRNLFNEGLRQLKESGKYDQIIADALAGKYAKAKVEVPGAVDNTLARKAQE